MWKNICTCQKKAVPLQRKSQNKVPYEYKYH